MNVNNINSSQPYTGQYKQQASSGVSFPNAEASAKAGASAETQLRTENSTAVTENEKEFFAELFPESAPEIHSYQSYGRRGVQTSVRLGTNVDRKG